MKNVFKKIAVIAMAVVMGTGVFAGCAKNTGVKGEYTYNDYVQRAPNTWNPHATYYTEDSYALSYTTIPFYSAVPTPDGEGGAKPEYEYVNEMASAKWTDVTQTLSDEQKVTYGIAEDEKLRAIQIPINPNAKWSNGDKITAKDYVESFKRLLDPEMQNYRVSTYISGTAQFVNTKAYFAPGPDLIDIWEYYGEHGGVTGFDPNYFSISAVNTYIEQSLEADLEEYAEDYIVEDVNILTKWLAKENNNGVIAITEANRAEIQADCEFIAGLWGISSWKFLCFYWDGETYLDATFDEIGIFASADGTKLTYVFESERKDDFEVYTSLASTYLVHTATYDAGYSTVNGLKVTNYGTAIGNTMSYGPYKMVSAQPNKLITYERNDQWYGWTDGNHVGQYQTTRVNLHVVPEDATALQMFLKGEIDNYNPTGETINEFRNSQYFESTPGSYPYRLSINTDLSALTAIQTAEASNPDVKNITILSDVKFRQALSLGLNRSEYVLSTPGYMPSFAILMPDYYADYQDASSEYRSSLPAMLSVLDVYNVTTHGGVAIDRTNKAQVEQAYKALTGYDITKAKALLTEVYNNLPAGVTKNSDGKVDVKIRIACATPTQGLLPDRLASEAELKKTAAKLSEGTNFNITIKYVLHADRYGAMKSGSIEAMYGAMSGSAYPIGTLRTYLDTSSQYFSEYGVDNTKSLTINIDGTNVTKTLIQWLNAVDSANGEYSDASSAIKNLITAALEKEVTLMFNIIPICYEMFPFMSSAKAIDPIKGNGHLIAGTGGIRLRTYRFDDYEWFNFLKKNKNDLRSIYRSSGE